MQAHKPATVSGGGKSEISKSLLDAFVFGEAYVGDVDEDFDAVQAILDGNYADRFVEIRFDPWYDGAEPTEKQMALVGAVLGSGPLF